MARASSPAFSFGPCLQANKIRKLQGENKVDFQGVVKVGESGIFREMDVYCLVIAPLL